MLDAPNDLDILTSTAGDNRGLGLLIRRLRRSDPPTPRPPFPTIQPLQAGMPQDMCKVVSQALHEIDADPRWASESLSIRRVMASAIERSEATVSRLLSEETSINHDQTARLSRALCMLGDTRLAACFVTGEFEIRRRFEAYANGRIDDEITDLGRVVGHYIDAFEAGDAAAARKAVHEGFDILARMRAEVDRL